MTTWNDKQQIINDIQLRFTLHKNLISSYLYVSVKERDEGGKAFDASAAVKQLLATAEACLQQALSCNTHPASDSHHVETIQTAEMYLAMMCSALQTCRDVVQYFRSTDHLLRDSHLQHLAVFTSTLISHLQQYQWNHAIWIHLLTLFDLLYDRDWTEERMDSLMSLVQQRSEEVHVCVMSTFMSHCLVFLQKLLQGYSRSSSEMVSLVFQQHFIILLAKCLPSYAVETTMLETWRCLDISTIDVLLQHCLTDSKSSTERNGKLALIGLSAQSCCTSFGIDYDGVSKSAMLLLQVLQGDKTDRNSFSSNSIQFLSGLLQGHSKFSAFDDNTGMAEASERFQVYLAIQEAWWNDQYSQSGEVNLYSEAMETFVDIFVQSSRKLRNVVIPCLLQAITRSTQHMDGDEDKIDYNTDTNRLVLLECLLLFYDSNAANGSDSYNDDYQTKHAVDAILYSFEMNCMDDGEMSNIFLTILTRHIQSNRSNLIASALFMQLYQTLVMYQPSLIVLYFKTACQHLSSFPHEVQLQLSKNIVEFLSLQQSTSCGAQQDLHQFLLSWRLEGHIYSVVDETISQHIETQIFANLTDDKNCLALSKLLHQDSVTLQIDLERWLLLYTALQCSGDDSEGHSLVHLEELLHVWTNPIAVNSSPSFPPQRTGICKVLSMVFNFLLPLQSRSLYKLLPAESIFAQLHRCLSLLYWFLNSTAKSLILIVETTDKQIDLVTPIRVLQAACSIVGYGIRQCVKLNPRKSSAPTALLAFSEAIQDAKNVDQNLPISLVDFSRQAYSVLLPSTNMQQQSNDRSDMAPGDDRMDSVNRDDEEMANQDNDEQIAEELYSSESCIPTSLLLNHFEKQLTTWFTIMEGSSTSGKCLPLIWLETQLLALTYTITALHHSIQISYQENQASGLTLESWQFLVNGYMRLMSSTTLKQLSSLFERSEATSNSYKPPKRNKLRFDMNQYLGHHSLAHVMYLLYDPLVLFDEASPSTFTLANSTLPESDEDDDDLRIMAFQVRRTTASIDPIQLQSQLVAGANNTYASFDTSTSMFRLSKALTASIRNCLLQCTTVQSSALEELFRPIASNYYQAGHRSFASKKSEEENIFHLSSMQQQLQSAYLLLLKDATRSIITQQEEDQPISIAKNDLRSYMLYLTKDLMQSIIRGIPLRNLKMMLHLLYYLEQLPLSASTSISTADVDVSTNLDESTIEVSLQLIFCLPECLDVPLYLLTNLLQLSIRLSGSKHALKFIKYLIRSASFYKFKSRNGTTVKKGTPSKSPSNTPSTKKRTKKKSKKKGLLFYEASEDDVSEEEAAEMEGQMMDVQQSITMLLTSHFASDSVDNDVDIIPKMLLLPLVEERLHDFVLNEVLRYLLQLQEEDVEQALALIDPVEAFRSSQKLHGIVQVLAYFIHPTSPAEQQNSFVDKVMLDRLDSKSFNVLISLFQNMLTLMLNDFKTISDQLLTSLDDVDNKTAVGTAAITSIMPVLSYFQDPLDGKVKAYSRVSNIAIWLDLVQIEDDEENEENDLPSFTDVYLMIKKWCYEQLYGSSNSKPSSASKSRKSSSPLKDSTFANKRLYALLKRMETVENKLTAFHDLIANSGLALTPDFLMFAEAAQDTFTVIQSATEELQAMKPTEATPTRKMNKHLKLKLFNGDNDHSAKSTPTTKKRNVPNNRLRSRNAVVDAWLSEEDDGGDAYADLEDFLVF